MRVFGWFIRRLVCSHLNFVPNNEYSPYPYSNESGGGGGLVGKEIHKSLTNPSCMGSPRVLSPLSRPALWPRLVPHVITAASQCQRTLWIPQCHSQALLRKHLDK